jgi:hypothetical protein
MRDTQRMADPMRWMGLHWQRPCVDDSRRGQVNVISARSMMAVWFSPFSKTCCVGAGGTEGGAPGYAKTSVHARYREASSHGSPSATRGVALAHGARTPRESRTITHVLDGQFVLAHLMGDQPGQVEYIGMVRLDGQISTVGLFGRLEPAAAMVLDRDRERLGDCGYCRYSRETACPRESDPGRTAQ